jgi:hypothetical protein
MTRQLSRAAAAALLLWAAAPLTAAPTLSLSPAVVPLKGRPGQSTRQTLSLTNGAAQTLAFDLEARDVVVRDGRRVFLEAGETRGSIAATAVFSTRRVKVAPGQTARVDVTLTMPAGAGPRAVVVLFRGRTRIAGDPRTGATASIGTLLTFALSDGYSLAPSPLSVRPQTASSNLAFEQAFVNDGTEPVVMKGVTVILSAAGAMVAKVPSPPHRLLPGERATMRSDFAGELASGRYRALSTLDFEGRALTSSAEFTVR